jgi:hypothetical protein
MLQLWSDLLKLCFMAISTLNSQYADGIVVVVNDQH